MVNQREVNLQEQEYLAIAPMLIGCGIGVQPYTQELTHVGHKET